jgi:hypothetical protein
MVKSTGAHRARGARRGLACRMGVWYDSGGLMGAIMISGLHLEETVEQTWPLFCCDIEHLHGCHAPRLHYCAPQSRNSKLGVVIAPHPDPFLAAGRASARESLVTDDEIC